MSHIYKKVSIVVLSVVMALGSVGSSAEASHRAPKLRSGIKGDVMGIVCKTYRSGRIKCKMDEVAATILVRNATTGEVVTSYATDDGGFKIPLPAGTYRIGIATTTDPTSPSMVTVVEDKYTKLDINIKTDINFQIP